MKRFFPILTARLRIIGLGAQVSSGMILPFEQFPRRYRRLQVYRDASVDTLFLTPDEAMGLLSCQPQGKKIHSPSGSSC